jgi:hypothetical protein
MHRFISLNTVSPHLPHLTLTSEEKISTSSPHRGHFLIVKVGVRKCDVPGQLPNNDISSSKRLGSRLQSVGYERKKGTLQWNCMRAKAHKVLRRDCLRHHDRRAHQRSPISLPREERINPPLIDRSEVLCVSVCVRRREETELLAGLKISVLPAPLKVVLPATIPNLALRWPAIVAALAFTPKLHHCPRGSRNTAHSWQMA